MLTWRDDDDDSEDEYDEDLEDEDERIGGGGGSSKKRRGSDFFNDVAEEKVDVNDDDKSGGGSCKKRRSSDFFVDVVVEEDDAEEKVDDNDDDELYDNPRGGSDEEEEEEESEQGFMVDDYDTGLQDEYLRRVYGLPLLPNVDDEDDCEPIAKRLKLGYVGSRHTKYDEGKLHNEYDRRRMHRNPLLPDENVQEYNEGTTDVERSKDSSNKRAHLTPMDFGVGGSSGVGSGLDLMATSFNKFVDTKLEHMKSIRDAMTLERNLSTRLFEELDKISGLSEDNVIDAASIILDSSTKTKIFFGMSDERRAYYVKSRILIPSLP